MEGKLSPDEELVERIRSAVGGGTDKDIAGKLGVSPAAITNWKSGEGPSRKKLKQIAEDFKVSLDYLMYGNDVGHIEKTEGRIEDSQESEYDSLFKDIDRLNPEHRIKFDAIMEYARHQVAAMLKEQKENEPPRRKDKKSKNRLE